MSGAFLQKGTTDRANARADDVICALPESESPQTPGGGGFESATVYATLDYTYAKLSKRLFETRL